MTPERRDIPVSGRREYDPPGVPLREYLETLIRGSQVKVEMELSDIARTLREYDQSCREGQQELQVGLHKLKGEVHALAQVDTVRDVKDQIERDRSTVTRSWLQWLPSLLAAAAALYVAFFN